MIVWMVIGGMGTLFGMIGVYLDWEQLRFAANQWDLSIMELLFILMSVSFIVVILRLLWRVRNNTIIEATGNDNRPVILQGAPFHDIQRLIEKNSRFESGDKRAKAKHVTLAAENMATFHGHIDVQGLLDCFWHDKPFADTCTVCGEPRSSEGRIVLPLNMNREYQAKLDEIYTGQQS